MIDVNLHVVPGDQIFVRRVLISGLRYTHPGTVKHQILVKDGEPSTRRSFFRRSVSFTT